MAMNHDNIRRILLSILPCTPTIAGRLNNKIYLLRKKNGKRTYGYFSLWARTIVIVTGVIAQTFHRIGCTTCSPSDRRSTGGYGKRLSDKRQRKNEYKFADASQTIAPTKRDAQYLTQDLNVMKELQTNETRVGTTTYAIRRNANKLSDRRFVNRSPHSEDKYVWQLTAKCKWVNSISTDVGQFYRKSKWPSPVHRPRQTVGYICFPTVHTVCFLTRSGCTHCRSFGDRPCASDNLEFYQTNNLKRQQRIAICFAVFWKFRFLIFRDFI